MHVSIYLTNRKKIFFSSVTLFTYLKYGFIVANVVRLNITVGKISEASQEYTSGGVPC